MGKTLLAVNGRKLSFDSVKKAVFYAIEHSKADGFRYYITEPNGYSRTIYQGKEISHICPR